MIKTMKFYIDVDELYPYYTLEDTTYRPKDIPIEVTEEFYVEYKLAMDQFFRFQNKLRELRKDI